MRDSLKYYILSIYEGLLSLLKICQLHKRTSAWTQHGGFGCQSIHSGEWWGCFQYWQLSRITPSDTKEKNIQEATMEYTDHSEKLIHIACWFSLPTL